MEVYAGFLEHTDHHVGRLIDALEDLGVLDDTLVYYIIGDNGASAEGTLNGAFNEMANFNGMAALETPEFLMSARSTSSARRASYNHYAVGWAWAMDTPFQWTKQVASHWGGTRNGTIVHWPDGHRGEGRAALAVHPRDRRRADHPRGGRPARADDGQRRAAVADGGHQHALHASTTPRRPERHDLQYFEMFGNRGIYHKGWSAVTKHRTPWVMVGGKLPAFDDDVWELYDGSSDWTARPTTWRPSIPEKLHELQRLWLIEAAKYNVLPLDDRSAERLEPRPRRPADADPGQLAAALRRAWAAVREQRRQHQEQVVLGHRRGRGARRRRRGRDHRPGRPVRRLEPLRQGRQGQVRLQRARHPRSSPPRPTQPIPAGTHQVRMEFAYDGGGLAKGGDVTLYYDGERGRHRPGRARPSR